MKSRIFTPGPTQIPERVVATMSRAGVHHRSPEFRRIFEEASENLRHFFKTSQDVLILTASGTGAMEAAVANFLRCGDQVITIEGGKFGQRWGEISRAYGLAVHAIEVPWGEVLSPELLAAEMERVPDVAAVFMTHSETSTGVAFDIESLARVVRERSEQTLVIVDGITSVGVLPFFMDEWEVDVCVSGSQKGVMIAPGLAFIAAKSRAWQRAAQSDLPKYYFDLEKARNARQKGNTPYTPAVPQILGLQESLRMILENGVEHYWQKYGRIAHAMRAGVRAIGLELFASRPSNALTAIKVPPGVNGAQLIQHLRTEYGITVAGGQEHLKGRIFRVAHMGDYDQLDMIACASAVEMALRDLGWKFEIGSGVAALQQAYVNFDANENS